MTEQPPALPFRDRWVDNLRGLAIVLVVFSHAARGLDHAGLLAYEGGFLDRWIYAFHMPAFFFAAGLFAGHSLRRGAGHYVVDKMRTILWPYVVWSFLYVASLRLVGGASPTPFDVGMIARLPWEPVGIYWFLYALFVIEVVCAVTSLLPFGRPLFWVLCLSGWALEPHKPLDTVSTSLWAFQNVLKYGVYFALGDWSAFRGGGERATGSLGVALLMFAGMSYMVAEGHTTNSRWWDLPLAVAGVQGLAELSAWLVRKFDNRGLELLGRRSLEIYVAHGFVTAGVRLALLKAGVTQPAVHLTLGTLLGVGLPLLLNRRSAWRPMRWLFRFGG